jgi:nitrate reductase cytochrome c-type subunit
MVMNKKTIAALTVLWLWGGAISTAFGEGVVSERGDLALEEEAPAAEAKQYAKDGDVIPRDYVQQPPLIRTRPRAT